MKQIGTDIILQAVIEKKDRLLQEKASKIAEFDKLIEELTTFIATHTDIDHIAETSHDIVATSFTGQLIYLFEAKKQALTNSDIASATGASGPQISSALYRLKIAEKVMSEGDNKKTMVWGMVNWFDENGKLKNEYKTEPFEVLRDI